MMKTISILGCGWLGFPFAKNLLNKGWHVNGSTTSISKADTLRTAGIQPFIIDLNHIKSLDKTNFFASEYLLINIPPRHNFRQPKAYLPLMEKIESSPIKKIIFISSTSVYPTTNSIVTEADTDNISPDDNPLLGIERLFQKSQMQTTIVRFGGLIGEHRYPGRFFKPGKQIAGGTTPVNLIHLDDCIQLLDAVLEKECWNEVLNGVADTHPSKQDFYHVAAQQADMPTPHFLNDATQYKIVSNEKTKKILNLQFKHPDLIALMKNNALWKKS